MVITVGKLHCKYFSRGGDTGHTFRIIMMKKINNFNKAKYQENE